MRGIMSDPITVAEVSLAWGAKTPAAIRVVRSYKFVFLLKRRQISYNIFIGASDLKANMFSLNDITTLSDDRNVRRDDKLMTPLL